MADTAALILRFTIEHVVEAMTDTRIAVMQGARQVDKSTLARTVMRPGDR